jgi:hypothetical protein
MALSLTLPNARNITPVSTSVDIKTATSSKHYVWVIWYEDKPIASEANVPELQLSLPPGSYRLVLTFHGPAATSAEIKITSNGVTKTRKGSIGQSGSAQLTRSFKA